MAAMMKKGDPPVAKKNRFPARQRLASSPHNPNTTGISNFYYLCVSSHSWDGLCVFAIGASWPLLFFYLCCIV